jgi:small subunit ribosomal protein S20
MPITDSAKKAIRQAARKKVFNDRRRKTMRASIKAIKAEPTAARLAKAYQAIDKAVKTGVLHRNTAARKKSQVAKVLANPTVKVAKGKKSRG